MLKQISLVSNQSDAAENIIGLAQAVAENTGKVLDLNVKHIKTALGDASEAIGQLASASDAQAYAALALAQSHRNFGTLLAHNAELSGLAMQICTSHAALLRTSFSVPLKHFGAK